MLLMALQLYNANLQPTVYLEGARGFTGVLAWSQDSRYLATTVEGDPSLNGALVFENRNEFYIWDTANPTLEAQRFVLPYQNFPIDIEDSLLADSVALNTLLFNPSGNYVAIVFKDSAIYDYFRG